MASHEVVNAKQQGNRLFVRVQVFAVAETLALETLQFLPNGQKDALDVRSGEAF